MYGPTAVAAYSKNEKFLLFAFVRRLAMTGLNIGDDIIFKAIYSHKMFGLYITPKAIT